LIICGFWWTADRLGGIGWGSRPNDPCSGLKNILARS